MPRQRDRWRANRTSRPTCAPASGCRASSSSIPGAHPPPTCCRRWKTARSCRRGSEVTGRRASTAIDLAAGHHSAGPCACRAVINCAGLYGDRVDGRLLGERSFDDPPAQGPVRGLRQGRGEACAARSSCRCRTSQDQGRGHLPHKLRQPAGRADRRGAGQPRGREPPTARPCAACAPGASRCCRPWPDMPVTATYAGLRPASEHKDYQVKAAARRARATSPSAASARPASASALGLARETVFEPAATAFGDSYRWCRRPLRRSTGRSCRRADRLRAARLGDRAGQRRHRLPLRTGDAPRGRGGARRSAAARRLAGLKRRTRVTMGRCQGFYCLGALAADHRRPFRLH